MDRKPTPKLVTVFGGSGFVGRHVVRALAKRGYLVRAACRNPNLALHLQPLGNVGQIQIIQANIGVRWSVDRAIEGADHVINLVGAPFGSSSEEYRTIQEFGPRAVAEAARAQGATVTHVSAIGADADSPTDYASTKAGGENAVFETTPDAVIFRPSVIFGPEDDFFNRFANMARFSPALPLIGGGETKLQPVFVGDLAEAIARSVDGKLKDGSIYEIGGPDVMSFRQCMETMLEIIDRKRMLVTIPWPVARIQGSVLGMLPKPMLTRDQVTLLETDNVVSEEAASEGRTLTGIGISPRSAELVLPEYLWRFRVSGQYSKPTAA